ncbi:MAG: EAL domain-containing protein [Firmicutes bacterium]|nr:EAL domain-containing protein [Bacillota bacterium]
MVDPLTMFQMAESLHLEVSLDTICCRRAVAHFPFKDRDVQLIFVNVMPGTLGSCGLKVDHLEDWMAEQGMGPSRMVLEVTEREILDPRRFYAAVSRFRAAGFRFAVDDLGTGYSNLSLLADLAPEFVKLDLGFVQQTPAVPARQWLVESLVAFSAKIGASVVAEGVESPSVAEVFRALGVPLAQGYLYQAA